MDGAELFSIRLKSLVRIRYNNVVTYRPQVT